MSQLHLIEDEGISESFSLNKGEILVGREEYCDIRLAYPGVSRKHVKLLTVMDDTFLEDLASKNGTYVNGRLLKKVALNDGDIIQLGQVELRFEKTPELNDLEAPEDPDATSVIQPGQFGPNSIAARESGKTAEGITPVAERVERVRQVETSQATEQMEPSGLWARLKRLLGLGS